MAIKKAADPGYIFPTVPKQWTTEEQTREVGLRDLFDKLFPKTEPYKPSISGLVEISDNTLHFIFPDDLVINGGTATSAGGMTDIQFLLDGLIIETGSAEPEDGD